VRADTCTEQHKSLSSAPHSGQAAGGCYSARRWKRALFFYSSPGFLDETMAIYLATGLAPGQAQPEDDEVISKRLFPLSAAVKMVKSGRIEDGKTIAGVLWLQAAHVPSRRK